MPCLRRANRTRTTSVPACSARARGAEGNMAIDTNAEVTDKMAATIDALRLNMPSFSRHEREKQKLFLRYQLHPAKHARDNQHEVALEIKTPFVAGATIAAARHLLCTRAA